MQKSEGGCGVPFSATCDSLIQSTRKDCDVCAALCECNKSAQSSIDRCDRSQILLGCNPFHREGKFPPRYYPAKRNRRSLVLDRTDE